MLCFFLTCTHESKFSARTTALLSMHIKRVAIFQIRLLRFQSLFLSLSLSQNRGTLLRDMLQVMTEVIRQYQSRQDQKSLLADILGGTDPQPAKCRPAAPDT